MSRYGKIYGQTTSAGGTSTGTVLLLIFITLKLTGHIDWSWWWVMSPMWIVLGLILGAMALWVGVRGLISLWRTLKSKRAWARQSSPDAK